MSFSRGPSIVKDGLVLYLDAANPKSYPGTGINWVDLSGNSDDGILVNGALYNDDKLGNINFDGINDRCIIGNDNPIYLPEQTWSAWVNRISSSNEFNMFMGRLLPYFSFRASGLIHFSNRISGTQRNVFTTNTLLNNTWYNLSFTTEYNGTSTTMKIYVNGILNNSGTFTGVQSNTDSFRFTIGDGRNTSTWYPFNGRVSNVSVHDRTLSSIEIEQNYNATKNRFGL